MADARPRIVSFRRSCRTSSNVARNGRRETANRFAKMLVSNEWQCGENWPSHQSARVARVMRMAKTRATSPEKVNVMLSVVVEDVNFLSTTLV